MRLYHSAPDSELRSYSKVTRIRSAGDPTGGGQNGEFVTFSFIIFVHAVNEIPASLGHCRISFVICECRGRGPIGTPFNLDEPRNEVGVNVPFADCLLVHLVIGYANDIAIERVRALNVVNADWKACLFSLELFYEPKRNGLRAARAREPACLAQRFPDDEAAAGRCAASWWSYRVRAVACDLPTCQVANVLRSVRLSAIFTHSRLQMRSMSERLE